MGMVMYKLSKLSDAAVIAVVAALLGVVDVSSKAVAAFLQRVEEARFFGLALPDALDAAARPAIAGGSSSPGHLGELLQVAEGFVPVNMATATNPGDFVSMKNFGQLHFLLFAGPGSASEPITFRAEQATTVSGGSVKALDFSVIYVKSAATNLQGTGTFTKVTRTATNTYSPATDGSKATIALITINAEDLDVNNGFDCVRGQVDKPGTVSAIGGLLYLLGNPRISPPLSALAD